MFNLKMWGVFNQFQHRKLNKSLVQLPVLSSQNQLFAKPGRCINFQSVINADKQKIGWVFHCIVCMVDVTTKKHIKMCIKPRNFCTMELYFLCSVTTYLLI